MAVNPPDLTRVRKRPGARKKEVGVIRIGRLKLVEITWLNMFDYLRPEDWEGFLCMLGVPIIVVGKQYMFSMATLEDALVHLSKLGGDGLNMTKKVDLSHMKRTPKGEIMGRPDPKYLKRFTFKEPDKEIKLVAGMQATPKGQEDG